MNSTQRIQTIGVVNAISLLLPHVRRAGQLARRLQPQMRADDTSLAKSGNSFASALTMADLLLEDRVGSDILMLFEDARFLGEEYASDRISRFFPKEAPYIVTLDPVNGTRYYQDGLPQYETIVSICDTRHRILGAILYRPAHDDAFIGIPGSAFSFDGRPETVTHQVRFPPDREPSWHEFRLSDMGGKTINVDRSFTDRFGTLRGRGFEPLDAESAYTGAKDWTHSSIQILLGGYRGIMKRDAQLIDHAVFAFLVEGAGGFWKTGPLSADPHNPTFAYSLVARDTEALAAMEDALAA